MLIFKKKIVSSCIHRFNGHEFSAPGPVSCVPLGTTLMSGTIHLTSSGFTGEFDGLTWPSHLNCDSSIKSRKGLMLNSSLIAELLIFLSHFVTTASPCKKGSYTWKILYYSCFVISKSRLFPLPGASSRLRWGPSSEEPSLPCRCLRAHCITPSVQGLPSHPAWILTSSSRRNPWRSKLKCPIIVNSLPCQCWATILYMS